MSWLRREGERLFLPRRGNLRMWALTTPRINVTIKCLATEPKAERRPWNGEVESATDVYGNASMVAFVPCHCSRRLMENLIGDIDFVVIICVEGGTPACRRLCPWCRAHPVLNGISRRMRQQCRTRLVRPPTGGERAIVPKFSDDTSSSEVVNFRSVCTLAPGPSVERP